MSEQTLLNNRPKLTDAYRRILRFIHSRKLQPGDRLPGQRKMVGMFSIPEQIVFEALQIMTKEGALQREQTKGTVLVDVSKARMRVWNVALATWRMEQRVDFGWTIWHMLRERLLDEMCEVRTFLRQEGIPLHRNPIIPEDMMNDYAGLEQAVSSGQIDLVTGPFSISDCPLPVCVYGSSVAKSGYGVRADIFLELEDICRHFKEQGCRRVAVIYPKTRGSSESDLQIEQEFKKYCLQAGIQTAPKWGYGIGNRVEDGREVARSLLAIPKNRQPDGLLVIDDFACLGITDVLRDAKGCRPCIVVLVNEELPVVFSIPVFQKSLSIIEAVDGLMRIIKNRLLAENPYAAPSEIIQVFRRWKPQL